MGKRKALVLDGRVRSVISANDDFTSDYYDVIDGSGLSAGDAVDQDGVKVAPVVSLEQQAEIRKREITTRLDAIDKSTIRALRAKSTGRGAPQDDTYLSTLEDEAETLRAELATLQA